MEKDEITYIRQMINNEINYAYYQNKRKIAKNKDDKEIIAFIKGLEYCRSLVELLLTDIETRNGVFQLANKAQNSQREG